MTHDPMCPYTPEQSGFGGINSSVPSTQPHIPGVPCQCDLIARVREDERGNGDDEDRPWPEGHDMHICCDEHVQEVIQMVKTAADRRIGERFAAALAKHMRGNRHDPGKCERCIGFRTAVAAIEALGEER